MDINSLLSPTDTPRPKSATSSATNTPQSPFKHVQRTYSGPGRPPAAPSPLVKAIQAPSSIPAHVRSPAQQPSQSSPLISPVPTDVAQTPPYGRSPSTQNMDTLADLASMQNHQPPRSTPPVLNSRESSDSVSFGHRPSLANPRASFDIAMMETPRQILRGDFTGTSLSIEKQQTLADLSEVIRGTPSAYEAQLQIIKILHDGFVDHIYPTSSPGARRDARSYDLLSELRQARESADKMFALGEEQWLLWLQDESILAQSAEDRVAVVEKFRRAVQEEFGSPRIWKEYALWVQYCYEWAHDAAAEASADGMPDPERLVGKELFSWETARTVWDEAVDNTKHDMSNAHLIFGKYLQFRFPHLNERMSSELATEAMAIFELVLQSPHAEWNSTFETFSSFVSANFTNEQYEQIMSTMIQQSSRGKTIWAMREEYESAITQAINNNDAATEEQAWAAYIEWEKAEVDRLLHSKNRNKRKELISDPQEAVMMLNALYARAELRFPSSVQLWDEHVNYMIEQRTPHTLEILSRATRHCPWSGSLWKQYLLSSELADQSYVTTENIKHNATKTGMLEAAGIEEVIRVHDAWCGYLLRRARRVSATEDDADVAEMGIRDSMEAVESLASKMDLDASFETSFRIQRKYIEYLRGQGRLDNARKQFDELVPVYGRHHKFWVRFYEFEMQKAAQMDSLRRDTREEASLNFSAPFAVAVLKQGLEQKALDNPAALYEVLLNHCEDFEDADELQRTLLLERSVQQRTYEAMESARELAAAPVAEVLAAERTEAVVSNLHIGKRKRAEDEEQEADTSKRVRSEAEVQHSVETPDNTQEQLKRDREHASILVQHVPIHTSESKIRQYFSNCGTVQGLKSLHDEDNSFIIEFADSGEAQYALSRDGQDIDGSSISVILNTGSTLYVTNYPSATDESIVRNLFEPYGDVVSIRFPSLQGNKRRRFCYVEFKLPDEAQAALKLDGHDLEGLSMEVKISNPSIRKQRTEKKSDGRTVFVGQLPFKATEDELRDLFASCGVIENLNLPPDPKQKGRNRGIAFVTFENASSVDAALQLDGSSLHDRSIKVKIANENRSTKSRSKQPSADAKSMSPTPATNGYAESPRSTGPTVSNEEVEEQRQRTIALCDIPDTVNEERIRAIAEKIGAVRKVILKTNHAGALIEFDTAADAGKAALELENFEINPGRCIRVTTEREMLQNKPEKRTDKLTRPQPANGPTKRPQQPSTRKGGHLGQKRMGLGFRSTKEPNGDGEANTKKSNEDFRAMLGGSNSST